MSINLVGISIGFGLSVFQDEIEFAIQSLSSAVGASLLEKPQLTEEWKRHLDKVVAKDGKFHKMKVAYTPLAPPPVFWEYNCASCIIFDAKRKTCKWVNEWGFPNPGEIHPQAWCVLWMPKHSDKPLSFLQRLPSIFTEDLPIFP